MTMKARYTVVDGEVIAEKRGGVRHQYVPDPLGSTVALLDSTQAQTDTFAYWPYGEEASRTGTMATPFRYVGTQGYYRDSTSRTYVRARHLDTGKGRWLTQDPIGFRGGDWNLYRYVTNRPVAWTDPAGLLPRCFWECLFGGALLCAWCLTHSSNEPCKKEFHCTSRCKCEGDQACSGIHTGYGSDPDENKACVAAKKDGASHCVKPCYVGHCSGCDCKRR